MVNLMQKRKIWFLISALLLVPGIIALFLWQLKPGIDFKGGSSSTYTTEASVEQGRAKVEEIFAAEGVKIAQVQSETIENQQRLYVKAESMSTDKHANIVRRLGEAQPTISEASFETIDPQVGADVTRKAVMAIIFASLAIIIYIALSFRGVPRPTSSWQFGIFAVIALLHDVLFIIGFYSIMGHYFGWEVNADFVTAALTVMGFSVHDTIVVFDRLRENLKKHPSMSFKEVANGSVTQTVARSINTSLTVAFVLLAVVLLGGNNIRPFALTLLVGIVAGTYSSIFVATPLLDWWQDVAPRFAKGLGTVTSKVRVKRATKSTSKTKKTRTKKSTA